VRVLYVRAYMRISITEASEWASPRDGRDPRRTRVVASQQGDDGNGSPGLGADSVAYGLTERRLICRSIRTSL
jgi:hypothetical protein